MLGKEETVRSIRKTGQRLQTKPILSKPSQDDVRRRMEALESHWQRIKLAVPRRRKNIEDKLNELKNFNDKLEELYIYTSTTKDLLDTQASLGKAPDDPKNVEVSVEYSTELQFILFILHWKIIQLQGAITLQNLSINCH